MGPLGYIMIGVAISLAPSALLALLLFWGELR
jgi:hypothetical protein